MDPTHEIHEHPGPGAYRTIAPPAETTTVERRAVEPMDRDGALREARARFGGLDLPAGLAGMLVALATIFLFGGIAAAAVGAIAFQAGLEGPDEITVAGLVAGGVTLFVAFLFGGWAAGRIARYSGGRNGLFTVVWFLLLGAVLAGLGALAGTEFNLFDEFRAAQARLPNWFSDRTVTTGAIFSTIAAIAIMLLGGFLGGLWGERYHRRADAAIVDVPDTETVGREHRAPIS